MFTFGFWSLDSRSSRPDYFGHDVKKLCKKVAIDWRDQQKTESNKKGGHVAPLSDLLKVTEKPVLSNNVAAVSVHNHAVQLPRQWRQRMRSKITLNIKVSQAGAIVVAMHVTETCETSLDNGNRDLLKLKLQET
jgi:hypothetical protein